MVKQPFRLPTGKAWNPPNGDDAATYWQGVPRHSAAQALAEQRSKLDLKAEPAPSAPSLPHYSLNAFRRPIPGFAGHRPASLMTASTDSAPAQRGYTTDAHVRPIPGFSGWQPGAVRPERFGASEQRLQRLANSGMQLPPLEVQAPVRHLPKRDVSPTGVSKRTPNGGFFSLQTNLGEEGSSRVIPQADRMFTGVSKRSQNGGFFGPQTTPVQEPWKESRAVPKLDASFTGASKRTANGGFFKQGQGHAGY